METIEFSIIHWMNRSSFGLNNLPSWAHLEEHLGKANWLMIIETFSVPWSDYRFILSVLIRKYLIIIHKNVNMLMYFHGSQSLKHSEVKTGRYRLKIRSSHCTWKTNYRIITYLKVFNWLLDV